MTRNEFIHRAALALLPHAYAEHKRDFDATFTAAISLAEDFANAMQNGNEAPWDDNVGPLDRLKEAIHVLGSPHAPLHIVRDSGEGLDATGMRR